MKPILTPAYFWGNLQLQHLSAKPSNTDGLADRVASGAKRTEIDRWIAKYEQEAIEKVLGDTLAEDFSQGISEETPDDQWVKLKAIIYDEENNVSFVANYVWFKYNEFTRVRATARAVIEGKVGSSVTVSNTINEVEVWNEFVILSRKAQGKVALELESVAEQYSFPTVRKINEFGI